MARQAPYSLLLLLLFHVKPPLGERAVCSPSPLLFPFLLDTGVQLRDGADAPDGVLNSLQTGGEAITLHPAATGGTGCGRPRTLKTSHLQKGT